MVSSGCPANTKHTPPNPPAKKFFTGLICCCFDMFSSVQSHRTPADLASVRNTQMLSVSPLCQTRPFPHKHTRNYFTSVPEEHVARHMGGA